MPIFQIQVFPFIYLYVGYFLYIFGRKSFEFMTPIISKQEQLSNDSIGTISSLLAIGYTIGKFLAGFLVDRFSPRLLFSVGLFGAGLSNLLFSISPQAYFPPLWFFNGLVQGPGLSACGKILRRRYSPNIFGSLWSALGTSINISGIVGSLLSSYIAGYGGSWRPVMLIYGIISCGYALLVLFVVTDEPEDINSANTNDDNKHAPSSKMPYRKVWQAIFSSFYTYILFCGFFVTVMTKGILGTYGGLYLIETKKADVKQAGVFVAWLEFGGIAGKIAVGFVSDRIVQHFGTTSKGHPRHYICISGFFVMVVCLRALQTIADVTSNLNAILFLSFLFGCCLHGNLSLCGILVFENSMDSISGTVHAFGGLFANIGLALSGLPFSKLVGYVGWDKAFQVCEFLILLTALLFAVSQRFSCQIGHKLKKE